MNYENYFKNMFESLPDFRKIVLLMFVSKDDNDLLTECGFLKDDINNLRKEFKNKLIEQNEEYLAYIKDQDSIIEEFLYE